MNIVDPNSAKKQTEKVLKGGEPYEAEPGRALPSEEWRKRALAKVQLTYKAEPRSYYSNSYPQLNGYATYAQGDYLWDEQEQRYYTRQFIEFKITYRYYQGQKRRSYLFWPKVVSPDYGLQRMGMRNGNENHIVRVVTESGEAIYAYLGQMPEIDTGYGMRKGPQLYGLWRSTGTMKPRRAKGVAQPARFDNSSEVPAFFEEEDSENSLSNS